MAPIHHYHHYHHHTTHTTKQRTKSNTSTSSFHKKVVRSRDAVQLRTANVSSITQWRWSSNKRCNVRLSFTRRARATSLDLNVGFLAQSQTHSCNSTTTDLHARIKRVTLPSINFCFSFAFLRSMRRAKGSLSKADLGLRRLMELLELL